MSWQCTTLSAWHSSIVKRRPLYVNVMTWLFSCNPIAIWKLPVGFTVHFRQKDYCKNLYQHLSSLQTPSVFGLCLLPIVFQGKWASGENFECFSPTPGLVYMFTQILVPHLSSTASRGIPLGESFPYMVMPLMENSNLIRPMLVQVLT